MHIRDQEIARLQKYAESLGLRVSWRKHKRGDPGALWINHEDCQELVMYTWARQSKTMIILNLLHELSHHLAFVYNNRSLPKSVDRAFTTETEDLTENQRRIIYETEKEDSKYRLIIAHELDLKIPKWRIELDIELDTWSYYCFWKEGKHPTIREYDDKKRELLSLFKN